MKVYVDKLPESIELCPFANQNNKKCSMTNDKCCFVKNMECEHLITLLFEPVEEQTWTQKSEP